MNWRNWFHQYATEAYYAARDAQLQRLEEYANGYATEEHTFFTEIEDKITFKSILVSLRGTARLEEQ